MRQGQKTKSHFSVSRASKTPEKIPDRHVPHSAPGLSAREFFLQERDGQTMADASRNAGVAYATIYRHVMLRGGIRPETAKKLEAWSRGAISATKTLGFGT